MVRRWGAILAVILAVAMMLPVMGAAQETQKPAEKSWTFYKLTLTVREMDGTKAINSRSYDFTQRSGEWGQLRVGSRVPVAATTGVKDVIQYQYLDIGLKVDSRVQERDGDVAFDWRVELSNAAAEPTPGGPVVRNVSSNGQTLLAIGKPVVMTAVDDTNSTHKFVFEITASKLK